jgi:hypothetical protein
MSRYRVEHDGAAIDFGIERGGEYFAEVWINSGRVASIREGITRDTSFLYAVTAMVRDCGLRAPLPAKVAGCLMQAVNDKDTYEGEQPHRIALIDWELVSLKPRTGGLRELLRWHLERRRFLGRRARRGLARNLIVLSRPGQGAGRAAIHDRSDASVRVWPSENPAPEETNGGALPQ